MREDFPQLAQIEPASLKAEGPPRTLFGLDAEALEALMAEVGEPAFRGRQLAEALYRQRITDLDAITTLPKALRQRLTAEGWQVGRPAIAQVFQSIDGTERYLIECQAGMRVKRWKPSGCPKATTASPATRAIQTVPKHSVPHPFRALQRNGWRP